MNITNTSTWAAFTFFIIAAGNRNTGSLVRDGIAKQVASEEHSQYSKLN